MSEPSSIGRENDEACGSCLRSSLRTRRKYSRATEQPQGHHEPTDCEGQFPFFSVRGTARRLRLFPGCFRIPSESSEYSSDLEEELSVAVITDGSSGFHRSKSCIDDESPNDVTRNVGRLGTVRKLVRLADLEGS